MRHQAWVLRVALAVSTGASCPRAAVGAVLVHPRKRIVLATGYNGAPRGVPSCEARGCEIVHGHCVTAEHAERNALYNAALVGTATEGAHLYVTHRPCRECARAAYQAGVAEVYYAGEYGDPDPILQVLAAKGMPTLPLRREVLELAGYVPALLGGA